MEKEFIGYSEALALKELGFNEPCFGLYAPPSKTVFLHHYGLLSAKEQILAPLYQQAFRWFSKKHRIEGWVQPFLSLEPRKCEARYWDGGKTPCEGISIGVYDTYEEAELECLKKLISIVKQ